MSGSNLNQNPIRPAQWEVNGNYQNLPGGDLSGNRIALRSISFYAAEQQARGSRWFGPNGVFGPAGRPSTATREASGSGRCQKLTTNLIQGWKVNRFHNTDNGISNPTTNFRRGHEPAMAPTLTRQANPATTCRPAVNNYHATNYHPATNCHRVTSYPGTNYPAIVPATIPTTIPTTIPATIPALIPATTRAPTRAPICTANLANATNGSTPPPTPTTPLVPSRMQQVTDADLLHAPRAPRRDLREAGVSGNYRGDISNPRNLSAPIPEERSCSFWLRGLPGDTTVTTLLAAVRGIGRVYCTVVVPPDRAHGWRTAAAKVVFFEEAAARRFWERYGRGGGDGAVPAVAFVVGGQTVVVERNRTRVADSALPRECSRVVCVAGVEGVVDVDALLAEFRANFVFEMDEIVRETENRVTVTGTQRFAVIEFRFGSFRCQAQTAYRLLQGRAGLEVRYGRDPCDR